MKKYALTLILIFIACASPFDSRESELPTNDRGTFIQPVSPQVVLFNLENSFKELIITNFMQSLDSNFFFLYDFVTGSPPEGDSGWAHSEELRLTELIFNNFQADSGAEIILSLTPLQNQADQSYDTTAVLYRSYSLQAVKTGSGGQIDTTEYLGTSIFTMVENNQGLWSLLTWEDRHQSTNIPSWADFKNGYR
ncbi:MAG TPA: hypothetical protein ENO22_06870 [candidate division Zixibacteria bacterium]|nr:hypothetical protein [candidate division Zixibacteria bacterium]